jgi:hypothetical protein
MSVNINYALSISGGGLSIQSSINRSGSALIALAEVLPAAKTGTLSTRTDDTDGELTMTAGHGITTGSIIDLYWDGGVRYGVVVGTVATNAVPFSGGSGDNLPIATTAITATVRTTGNVLIDGDNVKLIAFELQTLNRELRVPGRITFRDSDNAAVAQLDLVSNVPRVFDFEGGATNILTGNPITSIVASTGGSLTTETHTLRIAGVYDATP